MCSNSRTMKKQKTKSSKTKNPSRKSTFSKNPSRKTRTKTRKHKFLSLKTELSSSKPDSPASDQVSSENNHNQLNLFPLHPGNLFEERETHDENVDYFFDSDGGATLNGFVWEGGEGSVGLAASDHEDSLSPSLTYAYQGQDSEEGGGGGDGESSLLVRNALRHKQRDESTEEKWICYEEAVLRVEKKEEENSCCTGEYQNLMHGLCLKLDYEEIMNAWSDKGPLYIEGGGRGGDSSQIVPDVLDDPHAHNSTNVYVDGNVPQWKVPGGEDGNGDGIEGAVDGGDQGGSLAVKMGERKARVLRYKEKRQSRLFSKRIRYEVRKLNAEKRPRMKGRFVKRD